MEIVIPPRDHGGSTYKYEWDENGEVIRTERVRESAPNVPGRGRARQTVQWPFQSIVTETSIATPTAPHFPFRRATWQPRGVLADDESTFMRDSTLIPDYIVNYLRGETPETVARRKKNGGKIAERGVDVEHVNRHRPQQSRAADLEGFYESGTSLPRSNSSRGGSHECMLPSAEKSNRGLRRFTHGWRGGVALNALFSFLIFVAGFVCLIWAVSKTQMLGGESLVYSGSCSRAAGIDWGLHALLAVMVMVLIAGANYVFQVLSSPTRPELAAAHHTRGWLDIGIPSARNFAYIPKGRIILSIVLLAAAVITQVIYNSIIFTSQVGGDYNLVFVTQSFLSGAPFSNATSNNSGGLSRIEILGLQELATRDELVNLTAADCLQEFGGPFDNNFHSVLVISRIDSPGSSLLQTGTPGSRKTQSSVASSDATSLLADRSTVQFCLAHPRADFDAVVCNVSCNVSMLGVVALLNLLTVICTAVVLFKPSFEPLVTLGDAIVSFLRDPDPSTRRACLMTKTDVWQGRWGLQEPKYWVPKDHYWFGTPSLPRWLLGSLIWWTMAGLAAAALAISVHASPSSRLSPFGQPTPHAVYLLPAATTPSAASIIASLPQIPLAVLYFATNSLMSAFFLSHESSQYAFGRPLPLRVSAAPLGSQTTSLYLTLPRPWSWALLTLFAAMAFALRQAVLVVSIRYTDPDSPLLIALGFSGAGLLVFLALMVALAVVVLGLACRRAPPAVSVNGEAKGNPLAMAAGSCSAVISARCHALPREGDVWCKPVRWGVVSRSEDENVSHCAFSARGVADMDMARSYA